ncbi:MAG: DUF4012 domain-containing protein [Candidatus Komeilibacteria bacterium]|nr:DUF4012 domain-containing protein [Candidatus Komeilibacteria bacterium]
MPRKKKVLESRNESTFRLEDFGLQEGELAKEFARREKQRVYSKYELSLLVDRESANSNPLNRQEIPRSPHTLDLQPKAPINPPPALKVKPTVSKRHRSRNVQVSWRQAARQLSVVQAGVTFWQITDEAAQQVSGWRSQLGEVMNKVPRPRLTLPTVNLESLPLRQFSYIGRNLAIFLLVALLAISPLAVVNFYTAAKTTEGKVLGISQAAAHYWEDAFSSALRGDWQTANDNFKAAQQSLTQAFAEIGQFNNWLAEVASILPIENNKVRDGKRLLDIAEKTAAVMTVMSELPLKFQQEEDLTLMAKLNHINATLEKVSTTYQEISPWLAAIQPDILPVEYRQTLLQWQKYNYSLGEQLTNLSATSDFLLRLVGSQGPQRYLIFFQNSNELRATGGFLGSFALLDIDKGEIQNIEVPGGGTYDLKGELKENLIPPYPLQLLSPRWQIWDANWWPDWPTSAAKLSWFYEKSGGPTVDGVIAINSVVLESLLDMTGPIDLEGYENKYLTSDNVILSLQHAVEFEYDVEENKPKAIIGDLLSEIIAAVSEFDITTLLSTGQVLGQHLERGDIQIYHRQADTAAAARRLGWSGQMQDSDSDYLQVVTHNIGGGKSDAVVDQTVDYTVRVSQEGSLLATTTIRRSHHGDPEDVFERQRNVAFIRIYVPEGSELVTLDGATPPSPELFKDVTEGNLDKDLMTLDGLKYNEPFNNYFETTQLGKQVFGQWLLIDAGETKELTFVYKLPLRLHSALPANIWDKIFNDDEKSLLNYSLYLEKQSGQKPMRFNYSFIPPPESTVVYYQGNFGQTAKNSQRVTAEAIVDKDYRFGLILK